MRRQGVRAECIALAASDTLKVKVFDLVAEVDGVELAVMLALTDELAATDSVGLSEDVIDKVMLTLADKETDTVVVAVTLGCERVERNRGVRSGWQ